MKGLFLAIICLVASATSAQAAWKFNGIWHSYGFTVYEYPRSQAQLVWDDGTAGFVARYNPNPIPAPRCNCSVYVTADGRELIIENSQFSVPQGGWYRGDAYTLAGSPLQF